MLSRTSLCCFLAFFGTFGATSAQFDEPESPVPPGKGAKKNPRSKAAPKSPRAKGKEKPPAEEAPAGPVGVRLGKPVVHHWQVGVQITTVDAPATGIQGSIPVPTEWPDQSVRLVKEKLSPSAKIDFVELDGGLRRMTVTVGDMPQGDRAEALATFEVVKHPILRPSDPAVFRTPRDLRGLAKQYLSPSPMIESSHPKIKAFAAELLDGVDETNAWLRVETLYTGVRDKCKVERRKPKGAFAAMASGVADRDDVTGLFVAVCRASRIPARMVWAVDDSYAEFLLEDTTGAGHWIPCHVGRKEAEFGFVSSDAPILQRGDYFVIPEAAEPLRFVPEQFSLKSTAKPLVVYVRRLEKPLAADDPATEDPAATDAREPTDKSR